MKYHYAITASILALEVVAQRGFPHGGPQGGIPATVETVQSGTTSNTVATATNTITNTGGSSAANSATNTATGPQASTSSRANTGTQTSAGIQTSATIQAPTVTGTNGGGNGGGAMTISIVNSYSVALSIALGSNAGAPAPIGNPTPTTIGQGATTFFSFPTQWAGRIYVGKTVQSEGSKIEGSVTGPPDMDASYVDGYTVPIICTSAGKSSGCTTELFGHNGNYCNQTDQSLSDFQICLNPKKNNDDGAADPFFAPCAHQAYTYPSDNAANQGNIGVTTNCCIGTACGGGSSKRGIVAKREAGREAHAAGRHEAWWSKPRSHVHRLVRDAKLKR